MYYIYGNLIICTYTGDQMRKETSYLQTLNDIINFVYKYRTLER